MIKIDIVKRIAEQLKLKDKDALRIVDCIIDAMKDVICEYGRLEVRDFGVFQVKERKERVGRNPRNKAEYPIPPRRVVTFKLGKELKDHSLVGGEDGQEAEEVAASTISVPAAEPAMATMEASAVPPSAVQQEMF